MDRSDDLLISGLKKTARCRSEIKQLADEWVDISASRYDALSVKLSAQSETAALGILLDVAAVNQVKLDPRILAEGLKTVDNVTDIAFPCRFQDQDAIGPLLEVTVAEGISWERQALAACLAAELTVKFDQPKQPAKKVLWRLSREIYTPEALGLIHTALRILDESDSSTGKPFWLSERDVLRELPKERPPTVIGGDYTVRRPVAKLGRNDPCHCGSGRKYKKCCYDQDQELLRDASGYEGLTRTQLRVAPSLVEDTAPIETMRLQDLQKLIPSTLNDAQLLAAYHRAFRADFREMAFAVLIELKQRPGQEDMAVEHLKDLFDKALTGRDKDLVEKVAQLIPQEELYHSETSRFEHALLNNPEIYTDLEALCRMAMKGPGGNWEYPLLELSYAFDTILPALSVVFGRAAIVSEPERTFDNDTLFEIIEKNRIALDLEPWGDPIEEYLDWTSVKWTPAPDKDKKIEELEKQLAAATEKSALARKDLRRKEHELAALETAPKTAIPPQNAVEQAPAPTPAALPPTAEKAAENRRQIQALQTKIENMKEEIRSQQASRQELRSQLREANQRLSDQEELEKTAANPAHTVEEGILPGQLPKQIRIPEFSCAFRKSCEKLPTSVTAKALQAAAGFAAREESVLKQAAPLEQLPGYFRIRVGIHHRLLVRPGEENTLEVVDLIPRQNLDTWIRQHSS
jgi:hypothetical protein